MRAVVFVLALVACAASVASGVYDDQVTLLQAKSIVSDNASLASENSSDTFSASDKIQSSRRRRFDVGSGTGSILYTTEADRLKDLINSATHYDDIRNNLAAEGISMVYWQETNEPAKYYEEPFSRLPALEFYTKQHNDRVVMWKKDCQSYRLLQAERVAVADNSSASLTGKQVSELIQESVQSKEDEIEGGHVQSSRRRRFWIEKHSDAYADGDKEMETMKNLVNSNTHYDAIRTNLKDKKWSMVYFQQTNEPETWNLVTSGTHRSIALRNDHEDRVLMWKYKCS